MSSLLEIASIWLLLVGLLLLVSRKNVIAAFFGIELMLNAVNLKLFSVWQDQPQLFGQLYFTLFVWMLAVAETALALAIIYRIFKQQDQLNF